MKGLFLMDLVAFKCNAFFVQGGSIAKKSKERHLEKKEGRNGSFTTASGEHRVFTSQCRSVLKGASHFCSPCRIIMLVIIITVISSSLYARLFISFSFPRCYGNKSSSFGGS